MSIAPPSDIVLDVAQAADPSRLLAATSKLAKMAAGVPSESFESVLGGAAPRPTAPNDLAASTLMFNTPAARTQPISPYQKFEAMVLQNFVQNILPKNEDLFGDGASADICRSMLAEQIATQIAKTGKLGIAHMIETAHPPPHAARAGLQGSNPSPAPQVAAVPPADSTKAE